MNIFMPALAETIMANNDVQLLLNGRDTLNLLFYITNYATKKQARSHNLSALLASGLAYHFAHDDYVEDVLERQRLLIFRSINSVNRYQELAGPMVMMYLMGREESMRSHQYAPLYWTSFVAHLYQNQPELANRYVLSTCE